MMRKTNRSRYAIWTGQREYKIGISKNPCTRKEQVDKAIKGKIVLINQRFFHNATRIESMLRLDFIDSNFRMRSVKKGGGDTEWHYLTDLEYVCLEFLLWYYFIYPRLMQWLFVIVLGILAFAFSQSKTIQLDSAIEEFLNIRIS